MTHTSRPPYDLAIFDLDGTLADTMAQFGSFVMRAAERFGLPPIDEARLEGFRDVDPKAIVEELRIPFWKVPRIARYMRALAAEEPIALFEGAGELLRALPARGVKVAIVTSNSEANLRRALGGELFDAIEHRECGVSLWGKASRLRKVARRSRVPLDRAIYVGDELRDADAAASAGMDFGAVSWGYNRPEALRAKNPRHLFADLDDLATKISGAGLGASAA
ncbi:MAG TPA: HAD hydrolase-like protein [Vulgatibacter sp.]|nr:HAD hydrolase-like protein [Vulgatibacter sp.]